MYVCVMCSRVYQRVVRKWSLAHRGIGTYPLPWPHLESHDQSVQELPWNKTVGLHLLKGITQGISGTEFKVKDFLEGVELSIKCYVQALKDRNYEVLQEIMHTRLYHKVFNSLSLLPSSFQMLIDVESIRHLKLKGIHLQLGKAKPGDEHKLTYFGQTVVISKKKLEEIGVDGFDWNVAKEIGDELMKEQSKFLLSVTFSTKEKFAILDDNGRLMEGSNKFINGHHIWKYRSTVMWDNDYPFEWQLYDINKYIHSCDLLLHTR